MFEDLIEYEGLEEACAECFGFFNVTILRDFGPLKAGQKIESLWFDLEEATVDVFKHDLEKPIQTFKFKLEAAS